MMHHPLKKVSYCNGACETALRAPAPCQGSSSPFQWAAMPRGFRAPRRPALRCRGDGRRLRQTCTFHGVLSYISLWRNFLASSQRSSPLSSTGTLGGSMGSAMRLAKAPYIGSSRLRPALPRLPTRRSFGLSSAASKCPLDERLDVL